MKILDIVHDSIVDGIGLRIVIFFSGCPHKCKGCHNPQSWNINNGHYYTINEVINEIKSNKIIQGITFSGGEPFYQQINEIIELAKILKNMNYNIWAYSGYSFEKIIKDKNKFKLLQYIDVLVDGKYIEEQRDLTLKFKGSLNQRIIDVQQSLKQNKIILWGG